MEVVIRRVTPVRKIPLSHYFSATAATNPNLAVTPTSLSTTLLPTRGFANRRRLDTIRLTPASFSAGLIVIIDTAQKHVIMNSGQGALKGTSPGSPEGANAKHPSKKLPVEKRRFRTRTQCPKNLQERLGRSISQRMYLVDRTELAADWKRQPTPPVCSFTVAGSTGNIYTVTLDNVPTCTCPDFLRKRDLCKHIFFVLLKCIGVESTSPLLHQRAFLSTEIRQLLVHLEERRTGGAVVQASEAVRAAYQKRLKGGEDATKDDNDGTESVPRKTLEADADCPICFDSLQDGETVYCRRTCGTNFHADCIRRWMIQSSHRNCPNCRQAWDDGGAGGSPSKKRYAEGYVNLSDITGQSPERDTSTYYQGWQAKLRRRYY